MFSEQFTEIAIIIWGLILVITAITMAIIEIIEYNNYGKDDKKKV